MDTSDLVILQAYCAYHSNQQNLLFHIDFNMVAPAVKFKVTPVPAVPIVPTALSKNLAGPLSVTDLQAEPKAGSVVIEFAGQCLLVEPWFSICALIYSFIHVKMSSIFAWLNMISYFKLTFHLHPLNNAYYFDLYW